MYEFQRHSKGIAEITSRGRLTEPLNLIKVHCWSLRVSLDPLVPQCGIKRLGNEYKVFEEVDVIIVNLSIHKLIVASVEK